MFRMRVKVNRDILTALRDLPERAQRNLRRRLVTELQPELQDDVDSLMGQAPGPVSEPFEFNTARSARFWFALADANPELSDGEHYIRTGITEHGFRVSVSDRLRENMISIRNIQESPITRPAPLTQRFRGSFVYGGRYVLGHINTGWPDQAETAAALLREKAINRIIEYWHEAVQAAVKGVDL